MPSNFTSNAQPAPRRLKGAHLSGTVKVAVRLSVPARNSIMRTPRSGALVTFRGKRRWIVLVTAAALLISAAVVVAQGTLNTVSAPGDRFTARTAVNRVCLTTATTLVPIPGMRMRFRQRADRPEEVVVTFDASWPRPDPDEIPSGSQRSGVFVFLFIDGQRVDAASVDGGTLVHEGTASSVSNGTHGFTFVTEPIAPGEHRAEIFALDNVLGPFGVPNGTFCVDHRSLAIDHG
jgi:hypothetical protein